MSNDFFSTVGFLMSDFFLVFLFHFITQLSKKKIGIQKSFVFYFLFKTFVKKSKCCVFSRLARNFDISIF